MSLIKTAVCDICGKDAQYYEYFTDCKNLRKFLRQEGWHVGNANAIGEVKTLCPECKAKKKERRRIMVFNNCPLDKQGECARCENVSVCKAFDKAGFEPTKDRKKKGCE